MRAKRQFAAACAVALLLGPATAVPVSASARNEAVADARGEAGGGGRSEQALDRASERHESRHPSSNRPHQRPLFSRLLALLSRLLDVLVPGRPDPRPMPEPSPEPSPEPEPHPHPTPEPTPEPELEPEPSPEPKPYTATLPVDLSGTPGVTPEQQAEAERVVTETLLKLPKYADVQVAIDEGYTSIGDGFLGEEHYLKMSLFNDEHVLNPEYPESLVYDTTGPTKKLISAMYFLSDGVTFADAPRFGGPLTQWHVHNDLCFTNPSAPVLGAIPGVNSACPSGQFKILNPMIHVWIVPHPCGPFASLDGIAGGQIPVGEERLCDTDHGHGDGH